MGNMGLGKGLHGGGAGYALESGSPDVSKYKWVQKVEIIPEASWVVE